MINIKTQLHDWELREPFEIARSCITHQPVLLLELTGKNGVRGEYTRKEFTDDGGDADVWSIGYTRRF